MFTTNSFHLPDHSALLIHGEYSEYLVDYYLTLKKYNIVLTKEQDEKLKQLLACLAVHVTFRSPEESVAWTLHMHAEQPFSLFATGSSSNGMLVGQVLRNDIRHTDINIFHSQVARKKGQSSKSMVRFEEDDIVHAVESFYRNSEQLGISLQFFENSDEIVALIAMPGCDEEWFAAQQPRELYHNKEQFTHKNIKTCEFHYRCDCSVDKLLPYLRASGREALLELYQDDTVLNINCPRCGRLFELTLEKALEGL